MPILYFFGGFLALYVLKTQGVFPDMSWWLVTSPLWGGGIICVVAGVWFYRRTKKLIKIMRDA